jgi:NADPH:quinone reductase-like Zn-dependent oxidoreductase
VKRDTPYPLPLFNISCYIIQIMKSVQIKKYGSSEVIEINQSAPEPIVSVGKVLVIVKAAGVNPIDWKIREGYMQQLFLADCIPPPSINEF